jgi:hypothetical protein
VRPDQWAIAEARLSPPTGRVVAVLSDDESTRLEMQIRRTGSGEAVTAIEDRGISLFAAGSDGELAAAVGHYLSAHGFLRFAEDIETHEEEPPRPERLDVDAIWTHGDDFGLAANESEEAHA